MYLNKMSLQKKENVKENFEELKHRDHETDQISNLIKKS